MRKYGTKFRETDGHLSAKSRVDEVLAGLREERGRLRAELARVEEAIASLDGSSRAFTMMSVYEAATDFLTKAGEPKTSREASDGSCVGNGIARVAAEKQLVRSRKQQVASETQFVVLRRQRIALRRRRVAPRVQLTVSGMQRIAPHHTRRAGTAFVTSSGVTRSVWSAAAPAAAFPCAAEPRRRLA